MPVEVARIIGPVQALQSEPTVTVRRRHEALCRDRKPVDTWQAARRRCPTQACRRAPTTLYVRTSMSLSNLQVSSVTKSYGAKKLFEDVTVNFTPGKRYGLTGPNGAGKSTF